MADRKNTELTALTSTNNADLLYVVDDPNGTPVSKKVSLKNFFNSVPANTTFSEKMTVSGNTTLNGSNTVVSSNLNVTSAIGPKINAGHIVLTSNTVVSSNNPTTVLGSGGMMGSIFWDADYLYVATSNTTLRRVALSIWDS